MRFIYRAEALWLSTPAKIVLELMALDTSHFDSCSHHSAAPMRLSDRMAKEYYFRMFQDAGSTKEHDMLLPMAFNRDETDTR
ncbi:hypothetical protein BU26DRAFT_513683 [Trematosphaeria pertusa]|uniref:Uncharacterized protein n=1 Tax=Trematosphaeria pertusa TaxID=390896 RepID=A0A6A6J302_9PLEO|nr:uncharacterized protein BU26DRAFT_513683 [Trematosphaeria pertusa]KAF2256948.1 hypothetical protein BU26DRAFT_513683 [Trematosphaeria pertusa]